MIITIHIVVVVIIIISSSSINKIIIVTERVAKISSYKAIKSILLFIGTGGLCKRNYAKLRDLFGTIFLGHTGDGDHYVAITPTNKVNSQHSWADTIS